MFAHTSRWLKELLFLTCGTFVCFFIFHFGGRLFTQNNARPPLQLFETFEPGLGKTSGSPTTLFIAGSDICKYSNASIGFHRELVNAAREKGIVIQALVPTEQASKWYVSQLGMSPSSVHIVNFSALGIDGTPTIILRDSQNKVEGLWEGFMPSYDEKAMLSRLSAKDHVLDGPHLETILVSDGEHSGPDPDYVNKPREAPLLVTDDALKALSITSVILDVRERDQYLKHLEVNEENIPLQELVVRAPIEIPMSASIVLNCSATTVSDCDLAASTLTSLRYRKIQVLDRGVRELACKTTHTR